MMVSTIRPTMRSVQPRKNPAHAPARLPSFFFSSRRRHTISLRDWSSDVCSSDLGAEVWRTAPNAPNIFQEDMATSVTVDHFRSEERRVGKECRSRWSPDHYKKNALAARRLEDAVDRLRDVPIEPVRLDEGHVGQHVQIAVALEPPHVGEVVARFFFSSRRRHTISLRDWSSDVCSSD